VFGSQLGQKRVGRLVHTVEGDGVDFKMTLLIHFIDFVEYHACTIVWLTITDQIYRIDLAENKRNLNLYVF